METADIAKRMVDLCGAGQYVEAITELYAPDVRQFENGIEVPGGREGLLAACRGWIASRTIHGNTILGVHVTPDTLVLEIEYDVTPNDTKRRHQWREAAVYRVAGGTITDVRFYYKPPTGS